MGAVLRRAPLEWRTGSISRIRGMVASHSRRNHSRPSPLRRQSLLPICYNRDYSSDNLCDNRKYGLEMVLPNSPVNPLPISFCIPQPDQSPPAAGIFKLLKHKRFYRLGGGFCGSGTGNFPAGREMLAITAKPAQTARRAKSRARGMGQRAEPSRR
jgi:hypothetical protein